MHNPSSEQQESLVKELGLHKPFSLIERSELEAWVSTSQQYRFKIGQKILRPDEANNFIYLILDGTVRLISHEKDLDSQISLGKRGPGQILGWLSILRGEPSEHVQASTETTVLALEVEYFVDLIKTNNKFSDYFSTLTSPHEVINVLRGAEKLSPKGAKFTKEQIIATCSQSVVFSAKNDSLIVGTELPNKWKWHVSTPKITGYEVGTQLEDIPGVKIGRDSFALPLRFVAFASHDNLTSFAQLADSHVTSDSETIENPLGFDQLGILDGDHLKVTEEYPFVKAKGDEEAAIAVCNMITLHYNVPFRGDAVKKVIKEQITKGKGITIELIAGVIELLGLNSQLAETSSKYINSIEAPIILFVEGEPCVLYQVKGEELTIAKPSQNIVRINRQDLINTLGENFRFVIPRRVASTPTTRFGWSWFTPLLKKYKLALFLVFAASLLSQLFGLAIPLLLQQIIDKVLSQGNLSSLNVLGTAMVVMALFQGVLQALRTYIFVDTTDRMDLTLGSAVIDRLLALPLSYFERRPVGELSQRLGELNNIRSFLTGTALISVLNIVFASLYILVMFMYSPFLSVIALSTFPLYALLVLFVSPIYKSLIRKRAVAQAKTQSHLIEVIGGIQTVKAQHFELTARWKWQDRYRHFVTEGFKSVALGSTAGEIGGFLNQISGLLVLWIGMSLVLKGEFTLGQLIAFRIISGNVTGPLLQLAGLYQGFQGVQLSMERLSDIIDQTSELRNEETLNQICLPPVKGRVIFENVSFRFGKSGPYQLDSANLEVEAGNFVGIVGQSGSGKSTMMKLLPRLYDPAKGRILIDDYDITKVDLSSVRRQIGIVPQDSLLFEGTVAENIALNDPQASDESIIEAAKLACAHDFIMQLGLGYATKLAEKGSNLSGGQRQRIAIARTLLSNPQLLVLDEATSALDFQTERSLCLNLQEWAKNKTVFFITHRLSTIRNADQIVVMDQGRVIEQGNHRELLKLNGSYAALSRQQEAG